MRNKPFYHPALHVIAAVGQTLLCAAFLSLAACASDPPPAPRESTMAAVEEGVPGGVFVNTVEVSARVTAIDSASRKVTLLGPDGKEFPVTVGPEAVNFDQMKVGDLVKATVTEELVIYLDQEGASPPDGAAGMVALAPKGARPGGVVAKTTQVTATVVDIDPAERTATLQFEDGSQKTFPVRDDIDLSRRKMGEKVVFLVTGMVAISVEKP